MQIGAEALLRTAARNAEPDHLAQKKAEIAPRLDQVAQRLIQVGNTSATRGERAALAETLMNDASALSLGGSFWTAAQAQEFLDILGLGSGVVIRPDSKGGYDLAVAPTLARAIMTADASALARIHQASRAMSENYQQQRRETLAKVRNSTTDTASPC